MEKLLVLSFTLAVVTFTKSAQGAAIEAPSDVVLDDLSESDLQMLRYLEQRDRTKRSGDIFGLIKEKVASGLKSKLGGIASASAHFSESKGHKPYYGHGHGHYPEHDEEKLFSWWELQKSVFHTLLQAAKAIKGGLIAIKGHLIKGSGYLVSAKGKLLATKGEALTGLGKHIASSALLVHKPGSYYQHEHIHPSGPSGHSGPGIEYGPPIGNYYGAPSGHEAVYHSAPHEPSSDYLEQKYPSPSFEEYKDNVPKGAQQGILILKKMPKAHNGNNGGHAPISSDYKHNESPVAPPFQYLPPEHSQPQHQEHQTHSAPAPPPPQSSVQYPPHIEPNAAFNNYGPVNPANLGPPATNYGTPYESSNAIPNGNFDPNDNSQLFYPAESSAHSPYTSINFSDAISSPSDDVYHSMFIPAQSHKPSANLLKMYNNHRTKSSGSKPISRPKRRPGFYYVRPHGF